MATATPTTDEDETLLIVYGTLRRGYGNHQFYLTDSEFIGECTFPGNRKGVIHVEPSETETARGEVFRVDRETLRSIDGLEGYDPDRENQGGYVRTPVTATLDDGREVEGEVYYVIDR